jgi:opacity protein-like surface antigen
MIRLSILAGAAVLAMAAAAAAQPADPNYQAQVQDNQARQQQYQDQLQSYQQKQQAYDAQRDAYARQRAGYRSEKDAADEQRRLWLQGLDAYEARYGRGSYEVYARAHPDVTTTVITPAGKSESRSSTTVIETPGR